METTWLTLIAEEMSSRGDSLEDITVANPEIDECTYTNEIQQYDHLGSVWEIQDSEVQAFMVWTQEWIYFSCVSDHSYYVKSMPRNPNDNEPEFYH